MSDIIHLTVEDVGLWLWHLNFWLYLLILLSLMIIGAILEVSGR